MEYFINLDYLKVYFLNICKIRWKWASCLLCSGLIKQFVDVIKQIKNITFKEDKKILAENRHL